MFSGMYRGIVKSHGSNGLCKVFVPSIMPQKYENTPDELPWSEPAQPLFATTPTNGMFQYPSIGSSVWVFFTGGDINQPVMFACSIGSNDSVWASAKGNNSIITVNGKLTLQATEEINLIAPIINQNVASKAV